MSTADTPPPSSEPTGAQPDQHELRNQISGFSRADWKRSKPPDPDKQGLPAAFCGDRGPNGQFVPGHSTRGVARKRKTLREVMSEAWQRPGDTEAAVRVAAYAAGCKEDEVPEDAKVSVESLVAWVFSMRSLGGSVEHFREIGDRVDPKPQRIQLDATLTAKRAPITGSMNPGEAEAALDYYNQLSADSAGSIIDLVPLSEPDGIDDLL